MLRARTFSALGNGRSCVGVRWLTIYTGFWSPARARHPLDSAHSSQYLLPAGWPLYSQSQCAWKYLEFLSWRPAQSAASKQVKVQVEDALPGVRTNVGQESVTTFGNAHVMRQLRRCHEEVGQYRSILERQV